MSKSTWLSSLPEQQGGVHQIRSWPSLLAQQSAGSTGILKIHKFSLAAGTAGKNSVERQLLLLKLAGLLESLSQIQLCITDELIVRANLSLLAVWTCRGHWVYYVDRSTQAKKKNVLRSRRHANLLWVCLLSLINKCMATKVVHKIWSPDPRLRSAVKSLGVRDEPPRSASSSPYPSHISSRTACRIRGKMRCWQNWRCRLSCYYL